MDERRVGRDTAAAARTIVTDLRERPTGATPVLLGVAGGVAAGKSTVAAAVVEAASADGLRAEIMATDAFLLPNAELERLGLSMRKGFPESYDVAALSSTLRQLQASKVVVTPVYSHLTYDRVPGEERRLDGAGVDVVVVEGVNALQPAVAAEQDRSVYVDAAEADAWCWFLERFLRLCEEGRDDPTSFYAPLAPMAVEDQRAVADAAWAGINLVNLHEHIRPTRESATWVLAKGPDHSVRSLDRRR
ncbi:MAG: type I pantothenate kinase [Acidimicrobiia bacterium]|nr:type I pantothenate kinase [Acidimicrobiia bacterium]